MMGDLNSVSQFFHKKGKVDVTILNIIDPSHYILKESPSLSMSREASTFMDLEQTINNYYNFVENEQIHVPAKEEIVIVLPEGEGKYYRARVKCILNTTKGPMYSVYLLDYGTIHKVKRGRLFKIQKEFLLIPFQAVHFRLVGLKPLSMIMNPLDLSLSYGPADEWDDSAKEFVQSMLKDVIAAEMEILGCDKMQHLHGLLHLHLCSDYICLNDMLRKHNYAYFSEEEADKVSVFESRPMKASGENRHFHHTHLNQDGERKRQFKEELSALWNELDLKLLSVREHNGCEQSIATERGVRNLPSTPLCDDDVGEEYNSQTSSSPQIFHSHKQNLKCVYSPHTSPSGSQTVIASQVARKVKLVKEVKTVTGIAGLTSNQGKDSAKIDNTDDDFPVWSAGTSTPVKNSNPYVFEQKTVNIAKSDCNQIYKYVDFYRTTMMKSNMSSCTSVDVLCQNENEQSRKSVIEVSTDNINTQNSHIEPEMETKVKNSGAKCNEANIMDVSSLSKCDDTHAILSASKPLKSKQEVPVIGDFFKNISSKIVANSLPSLSLQAEKYQNVQHAKNSHFANRSVVSDQIISPTSVNSDFESSGVKCGNRIFTDEQLKSTIHHFHDLSSIPSVGKIQTIGRGVPVSKALKNVTCCFMDTSPKKGAIVGESKCTEENLKQKVYPTDISLCSKVNKTVEQNLTSSHKPQLDDTYSSEGSICKSQLLSRETSSKNGEFEKSVETFEASSGNESQLDISFSDADACDTSDEVTIDQKQNMSNFFAKKFLNNASTGGEGSCIDPYFKTDLDFTDRSLFDEQRIPAVQIGGISLNPILRTEEAPFVAELHECLKKLRFWGPSCIQSVVWPAVLRGRSFIAVAPPHSGKSIAYVLPILSSLLHRVEYSDLPSSNGPLVVILCSSWKKVQALNQQVQLFLGHCGKVSVITLYNGGGDAAKKKIDLLNGCDILIATPACLLEYLNLEVTNFERCCHLILDDGNNIIKHHANEVANIMKHLLMCIKIQKRSSHPVQIGVCVEHWARGIHAFAEKFMPHHLLFFTSFLECAVYGGVPIHLQMCQESTKSSALLNLLDSSCAKKIVICTIDALSATEIHQTLLNAAVYSLLAHEAMTHFDLLAVKKQWTALHSPSNRVVLVLTDAAVLSLNINDTNCLIHYDLPQDSQLQFSYRFGCIAESFTNLVNSKVQDCVCHVFVSEKCHKQAAALVKILRRVKTDIPEELKIMASKQKQSVVKLDAHLCPYFKALGSCSVSNCCQRHTVNKELDKPTIVPYQGDVNALVSHVFDAAHYYVRVLHYVDPLTGGAVSKTGEYAKLSIAMQDFYNSPSNQMCVNTIEENSLCCVREETGIYHRAKVREIIHTPNHVEVDLVLVDEGWVKKFALEQLLILPEEFSCVPPLASEVYLCGIKPADSCSDWNPDANRFVYDLISGQEIHGKIVLCLNNTLFLDPITLREQKLSFVENPVNVVQLGKLLKNKGFATENRQHLPLLYEACKGKIDCPVSTKHSVPVNESGKANWAFLELEVEEDVYVSHVESPHQFFVQRAKFSQSLDKLVADVNRQIDRKVLSPCRFLQKGMYCLAPIPEDDRYYRGEVIELIEDEEAAHIFFVDFGDFCKAKQSEIYAIPSEFLLLPFQAIECELAGIFPPHGGWTESATEVLFNVTRDEVNCMKLLRIKANQKTFCSSSRNRYTVGLFFSHVNVADFLLKEGLADPAESSWSSESQKNSITSLTISSTSCDFETSSSSTQPPEDKEPTALISNVLSTKQSNLVSTNVDALKQINGPNAATNSESKQQNSISQYMKILEGKIKSVDFDLIDNKSNLNSSRLKAKITWWNTVEDVTVTIHLPGIIKYDLELFHCGFKFSTTVKNNFYFIDETFYADVVPDETKVKCLGHCIELLFCKKVATKWPRLIQSKEKVFYIKYDLFHLESDSDSENKPTGQIDMYKENSSVCNVTEDITDCNSTSSDDEYYVPTWSEMCEGTANFISED